MEKVCPICNGIEIPEAYCPACGQRLVDGGALEDFWGPYSPYMSKESLLHAPQTHCVHLLYCANCHYDTRFAYQLVTI